jgi:hypothetical protein
MKWLSISSNPRQEVYELWNTKEKLLTLHYHPDSGTLRISADDKKRVFLIGREGFLRRRTVLRNEYGIRMGQLTYESSQEGQGTIEIYDERFNYLIQNNFPPEIAIYKNAEPLVTCELPVIPKKHLNDENHDLLILALCWYILSSVEKQVEEYA